MKSEPNWDAIARYCAGETTSVETEALLRWAAADPAKAETLESARRAWNAAGAASRDWDVQGAWRRVSAGMVERQPAPAALPFHRRPRSPLAAAPRGAGRLMIAAGLAAVLAGGLMSAAFWAGTRSRAAAASVQELITPKGERAQLRLSDGTEVVLGPESRLEVSARYGEKSREVALTGEAYFDVTSDSSRPFLVTAGGTVTRVLGTEFDVRAYATDSTVRVVVAEGQVSFGSASDAMRRSTLLGSGELGEHFPRTGGVTRRRVDIDSYLGWRDGRLAFEDAPLSQVVTQLERWYGVPVRIGDPSLAPRCLTASFQGQPVEEVIAVIAASLGLEYARAGQVYTFFPRGRLPSYARS